jgi:branched-chain amino acid transport system substrate-binding protein
MSYVTREAFAYVGNADTPNTLQLSRSLNSSGVPLIASVDHLSELHEPARKYTYNFSPSWKTANQVLGTYIVKNGAKRVAMVYPDDADGHESVDALDLHLKELTGQGLVVQSLLTKDAPDFTTPIASAKRVGADTIVVIGDPTAAASILQQARTMNYHFRLYASPIAVDAQTIKVAGTLSDGMRAFVFTPLPDDTSPGMEKIKENLARLNGTCQ